MIIRWRWIACGAVCMSVGCGPAGVVDGGGLPTTTSDSDITAQIFPDDNDATMASQPFVENELLVQPYPGVDAAALADLYQRVGARVIDELDEIGLTVLAVDPAQRDAIATEMSESELIEGIHKNYLLETQKRPDDADLGRQTYLDRTGILQAWDRTVGAATTLIAVVDTGVQSDHPDLLDRIAGGWNVFDNSEDNSDPVGHGTLVTGVLAAATDNAIGVAGVTWSNPVLVVRAGNGTGQATGRHVAAGILWAVGQGAKVINVSFAPLWSNEVVRSAARQAWHRGSLVVISAGNGGGMTTAQGYREALFVGATDGTNDIAFFSDRGPFVDVVAPGTTIRSTARGGGYTAANGTSFAAPIVAGVVALAWSMNPDLRPVTIAEVIADTATDLGQPGPDNTYGHGAVDARAAVDAAARLAFLRDDTPPSLDIAQPASGSVKTRRFLASATATDRWGVADVVLLVDDVPQATDTRSPFRFVIDSRQFDEGTHEIGFVATDRAGNASATRSVSVDFSRARRGGSGSVGGVVFESPSPGSVVSGDVLVSATVTADAGLTTIEWSVDGASMFVAAISGTSTRVSYLWRTAQAPRGRHQITITTTDTKGGQTTGSLSLVTR